MRQKIVAGNWKMNLLKDDVHQLIKQLNTEKWNKEVDVIVCPSMLYLDQVISSINNNSIKVGAQMNAQFEEGAFTGEVSSIMLQSIGVEYVLVGHSERRILFNETQDILNEKVIQNLNNDLKVIYCVGESLQEREAGVFKKIIEDQITSVLTILDEQSIKNIVFAYEPIWAIGTGKTATCVQAQEMHKVIRDVLSVSFGSEIADETSILYGGSCKPSNAKELFSQLDIDGGLIGGAALDAESFTQIIQSF